MSDVEKAIWAATWEAARVPTVTAIENTTWDAIRTAIEDATWAAVDDATWDATMAATTDAIEDATKELWDD